MELRLAQEPQERQTRHDGCVLVHPSVDLAVLWIGEGEAKPVHLGSRGQANCHGAQRLSALETGGDGWRGVRHGVRELAKREAHRQPVRIRLDDSSTRRLLRIPLAKNSSDN